LHVNATEVDVGATDELSTVVLAVLGIVQFFIQSPAEAKTPLSLQV
jgi:hypothetical protein